MYSIHLYEVIFTGRRHKPDSICNKTITGFCICEYEFLIDLQTNIHVFHAGEGIMKMYSPYSLKSTIFPEGNARGEYDTRGRIHFHIS
jgi:hypothetical protein